jgi:hypothetical protein
MPKKCKYEQYPGERMNGRCPPKPEAFKVPKLKSKSPRTRKSPKSRKTRQRTCAYGDRLSTGKCPPKGCSYGMRLKNNKCPPRKKSKKQLKQQDKDLSELFKM